MNLARIHNVLQLICYFRELVSEKKLKIILKDFMSLVCTGLILED